MSKMNLTIRETYVSYWLRTAAFLLLLAMGVFACTSSDPDTPSTQPGIEIPAESQAFFTNGLELSATGEQSQIFFTATADWTASVEDTKVSSWLTVSPLSGKAGKATLTLSAQKAAVVHKAVVTITCSHIVKKLTVTQPKAMVPVEKLIISAPITPLELLVGETAVLSAVIAPEEAADNELTWTSSAPSVAEVSAAGVVTAKALGSAEITATADGKTSNTLLFKVVSKKSNQGLKAAYADFLGTWIVTGTEHKWFYQGDEVNKPATYSYEIQIIENEKDKTYLIQNWETGATPEDAAHLYYGSKVEQSLYSYFKNVAHVNVDVLAWYDADKGQLHINRQTFSHLTGQNKTVEFLGDVVDPDGHTSIGSFNSTDGDVEAADRDYTICDFLLQENGSVNICASDLLPSQWMNMAFMGYARYDGFLYSMHYNKKFAFPYSMVKKPSISTEGTSVDDYKDYDNIPW